MQSRERPNQMRDPEMCFELCLPIGCNARLDPFYWRTITSALSSGAAILFVTITCASWNCISNMSGSQRHGTATSDCKASRKPSRTSRFLASPLWSGYTRRVFAPLTSTSTARKGLIIMQGSSGFQYIAVDLIDVSTTSSCNLPSFGSIVRSKGGFRCCSTGTRQLLKRRRYFLRVPEFPVAQSAHSITYAARARGTSPVSSTM
jgi:hypothetical protein